MTRSRSTPRLVPTEGLEGLRLRPQNLSPDESKEWFKIVTNLEGDLDEDEAVEAEKDGKTASVYIYDEIGGWFGTDASSFVRAINALDVETIQLHINSPGGSIFDGVAIYNALLQHEAKIIVSVDSLAASAASFIAQAGDEIIMRRASTMMIHDGSVMAWGDAAYLRDQADILDKLSDNIASIYAARTGGSAEDWRAVMIGEAWYTAAEAVEAGLADRVDGEGEEAENRWDLSAFMHAGRSNAPSPDLIRQNVMLNRTQKENTVARKVVNDAEAPKPAEDETSAPDSAESDSPTEGSEVVEDIEDVEEGAPVEEEEAPAAKASNRSRATSFSVMVNGLPVSDVNAIQTHINTLEGFYNEARETARAEFVDSLATNGQIGGPQVNGLKKMVSLENMSDEQFDHFRDTYKNAPQLPLLAIHGNQASASETSADKERASRIEVLQGIVDHHKAGGKSEEQIAGMASFKELQALLAVQDGQGS